MSKLLYYICRVSHADVYGSKYAKGHVVICSSCNDDPLFGNFLDILVTASGDCCFILNPLVVTAFNVQFNAYEVKLVQDEFLVYYQKDFADYHVLSLSKSFDRNLCSKSFVCLKYYVNWYDIKNLI